MKDKYFPIKTATACQLKWTLTSLRLYPGDSGSCHRVKKQKVTVENFDDFHNNPKKLEDRRLMLEGQWPTGGCEYCQTIEDAGGFSDRMLHLGIPNLTPDELESDPTAVKVTPKMLEVYFDNVCNMSCVYCQDILSSKIYQENVKFGRFEKQGVIIDNRMPQKNSEHAALLDKFWQWMEKYSNGLRRFQVLGGEPFYQRQFENCLDFFEKNPNSELEFNIVSNLMVDPSKFQSVIGRIKNMIATKKIKRFDLTASIDCFGPEAEYVRFGLDLETWKTNFEYAVSQKWVALSINQCFTALTIKTMPELLRYINEHRKTRKINHFFGIMDGSHDCLKPWVFGSGFFDREFDEIIELMPADHQGYENSRMYMEGIRKKINTYTKNPDTIKQLKIFLDEMDRRRGLDWRKTFPWIEKEIDNVV